MKLRPDEHLSPQMAEWMTRTFGLEVIHVRDLGLARAKDRDVFNTAREADVVLLTKDADFVGILEKSGPPPRVIWLTCGNTSNANLKRLLERSLKRAVETLNEGEPIIETE